MTKSVRICLLEPWYGGSHKRWADGLRLKSRHEIDLITLPARHWKWRMHGAAVSLSRQLLETAKQYDLILASDMMDVAVFRGLLQSAGINTPLATYFHENQISYPVSLRDTDRAASRDLHYGFINYTSALASDILYFNSHYHRKSFLGSLPGFLKRFPDHQNAETIAVISAKAKVLPLGMNLVDLDSYKPASMAVKARPLLLWNHRWEYDKQPEVFLDMVLQLHSRGHDFELALLGERGEEPANLSEVRQQLGDKIVQDGPEDSFGNYANWLWRADILPVFSIQDFFGGSVVEALYCGCHPILPDRLVYPEHIGDSLPLYATQPEAVDMLEQLIVSGVWKEPCSLTGRMRRYDWSELAEEYDRAFLRAVQDQ